MSTTKPRGTTVTVGKQLFPVAYLYLSNGELWELADEIEIAYADPATLALGVFLQDLARLGCDGRHLAHFVTEIVENHRAGNVLRATEQIYDDPGPIPSDSGLAVIDDEDNPGMDVPVLPDIFSKEGMH
jgi:hypothetical protein